MTSLTHTKCFNHGQREAVARCPSCRRHFCRECITEHDHRLLCASCLAAEAAAAETSPGFSVPFRPVIQLASATLVLWLAFYLMGQALLLIPSEFHDTVDSPFAPVSAAGSGDTADPQVDGDDTDTGETAP